MKGHPKYNLKDKVSFDLENETLTGTIYIIDAYGTFEDGSDVSYDIMVEEPERCLYKHVSERLIK